VPAPDQEIEPRLRPGAWDPAGFLLRDEELAVRRATHDEACARLGTEPRQIGIRLVELLSAAAASDVGRPHRADGRSVTLIHQRGLITCPWAVDEFEACDVEPGGRPTANRFRIEHQGVSRSRASSSPPT